MSNSSLGDVDLSTDRAVQQYLERVRQAFRVLYMELEIAADELQAYLAEVPERDPYGGRRSHQRARIVAGHMRNCAEAARAGATAAVRTWRSMERQFAPELEVARGGNRKPKKPAFTFEGA